MLRFPSHKSAIVRKLLPSKIFQKIPRKRSAFWPQNICSPLREFTGVRGTPHIGSWVTNPWQNLSSWVHGKGMASHLTETSIKLLGFRPLNELHKRSNPKHCRCSLPAPIPSLQVFEEFPRKFSPHEVTPQRSFASFKIDDNGAERERFISSMSTLPSFLFFFQI